MTEVLELRGVSRLYDGVPAIRELSLTLGQNEYVSLLGPSGSGKSTLLRLIAGFEQPDAGGIFLQGRPINGLPAHKRGIGFVSQSFALFPHMTVFDNVAFGLRFRESGPVADAAEVRRRCDEMLALVGLEGLGDRRVDQISGGQKQRVALARTLVTDPRICLLDEPLGALDANLRARMTLELRRIRERLGLTFMHVTGNETEALAMGDRVIVLDAGEAAQVDRPEVVYAQPKSARVARFLNCYNLLPGEARKGVFACAGGEVALPASATALSGPATYCIRIDRLHVVPVETPLPEGQVTLPARYITREYTGPSVIYFFRLAGGEVVEVEYNLSHRSPDDFEENHEYRLVWPQEAGLVFAGRESERRSGAG